MPEKWTGELVGRMHNARVTYEQLAEVLGCTKAYVSMVLSGARAPAGAAERFNKAFDEILQAREAAGTEE